MICERLVSDADWTSQGAAHLARLVQEYRSFLLRNPAALAIATDVADGDLKL
jgi:hypothetical protein